MRQTSSRGLIKEKGTGKKSNSDQPVVSPDRGLTHGKTLTKTDDSGKGPVDTRAVTKENQTVKEKGRPRRASLDKSTDRIPTVAMERTTQDSAGRKSRSAKSSDVNLPHDQQTRRTITQSEPKSNLTKSETKSIEDGVKINKSASKKVESKTNVTKLVESKIVDTTKKSIAPTKSSSGMVQKLTSAKKSCHNSENLPCSSKITPSILVNSQNPPSQFDNLAKSRGSSASPNRTPVRKKTIDQGKFSEQVPLQKGTDQQKLNQQALDQQTPGQQKLNQLLNQQKLSQPLNQQKLNQQKGIDQQKAFNQQEAPDSIDPTSSSLLPKSIVPPKSILQQRRTSEQLKKNSVNSPTSDFERYAQKRQGVQIGGTSTKILDIDNRNLFEKILAGEVPVKIFYEDDICLAYEEQDPKAPVHFVVFPKLQYSCLDEVPEKESYTMGILLITCKKLGRLYCPFGYRIVIPNRMDVGKIEPSLHFHVLGGRKLGWPPG